MDLEEIDENEKNFLQGVNQKVTTSEIISTSSVPSMTTTMIAEDEQLTAAIAEAKEAADIAIRAAKVANEAAETAAKAIQRLMEMKSAQMIQKTSVSQIHQIEINTTRTSSQIEFLSDG